ncbi:trypsin-like peptidase domain-containing protein [Thioclava sp. DLFJ4-1]|uniref:trypsin-like peptidase domain-containing protein n=1 Tax=Thioclava sp. DLFJ4-1 TaxID=1915313 RepID=UPI000997E85E|nr:trypsin-like peptidase domain-containing protein [Thioclava sp. DLFJ4-1]
MRAISRTVSIVVGASLTGMIWTGTAWAEAWVQIEAKSSLAQAEARARDWAGMFPDTTGFRLDSGWYAIALGPFADDAEANARRRVLRREGLIPRDSFVADGNNFRQQFWPVGATLNAPAQAPEQPAPQADTQSDVRGAPMPAPIDVEPLDGPDATAQTDGQTTPPDTAAQDTATAPEPVSPDTTATADTPAPQEVTRAPEPVETLRDSRRLEAALDPQTKRDIQTALEWEGSYQGAIDGIFGRGTRNSIADWQMKNDYEPTGVLSSTQQAALLDKVASERAALGLQAVTEDQAGIRIDLPMGLVKFDRYNAPFVNYAPKDGSGVQVLLISQPGDAARLRGLYDAMQTLEIVPTGGERNIRGNSFTIEGQNTAVQSYTHAELSRGQIKGFTLVWPAGDDTRRDRVLDAMKKSFTPIGTSSLDATLGQPMSVTRAALMAGIEKRAPIFSRSGFFIDADGHVLTAAEGLDQCGRITIEDHPASLSFDGGAKGYAVLTPKDTLAPKEVAKFNPDAPMAGSKVAVAGFSYPEALSAPVLNFGTLSAPKGLEGQDNQARIEAQTRAGDVGGPVLDGTGAVVGMLLPSGGDANRVLPDNLTVALQAKAMAPGLSDNGFTPKAAGISANRDPEDLQQIADGMVVQISCWK